MLFRIVALVLLLVIVPGALVAQTRSMARDSTIDNLRYPPGTHTVPSGSLGHVRKLGNGPRTMLLIPGLGFGDGIWTEFMERHRTEYTMYAITLPGFGDTSPLPMPTEGSHYAEIPWTLSCIKAIDSLLEAEHVRRFTIVAHWALASQIALSLAIDHPDRVDAVILVAGVLKVYYEASPGMMNWTREQRTKFVEGMGQHWFKTVTRKTWDDNNFMSYDYAINPRRGLYLWRDAQSPLLSVWIRYLLEFYSIDLSPGLKNLRVPTLVVRPGFDDSCFYVEKGWNYMRNLCHDSWRGAAEANSLLEFITIPRSRLFIMFDQPEELDRAVDRFLHKVGN